MSTANMLLRRQRMLVDRTVLARVRYRNKIRQLQISSREGVVIDGIEHIEPYGFTSHALSGAECVVLNAGGRSGRGIAIMVNDRRHRIVVNETETAIYTANGEVVHLKDDNSIHIKGALKVFLETPLVECSQDLLVRGNAHIEGNAQFDAYVNVDLDVTIGGGLSVDGTTHGVGSITTDGDVAAGAISLTNHRTSDCNNSSGISGGPVA